MAQAIITLKIMPESPDEDLDRIQHEAEQHIDRFVGEKGEKRFSQEPIAFGLKALNIIFVMDEAKGGTEKLEDELVKIPGVQSVDVVDVRRAIG
jgi:elongation factor 1-beta